MYKRQVFYPFSRVDSDLQEILIYFPTVSSIQFARDSFFNPSIANSSDILKGFIVAFTVLMIGYLIFSKRESRMVDF